MVYSNDRKLALSGWLRENNSKAYGSPLRLQKYLFFYEAFCKVENQVYDFDRLRGYKRGPVFSTVWGDYTKDREEFNRVATEKYDIHKNVVDERYARRASFVVSVLSERELSQLTHKYRIWNAKAQQIMAGEQQVELQDSDFGEEDYKMTKMLETMYPDELIADSDVLSVDETHFVFAKDDIVKLTECHLDTLSLIAEKAELQNPVFVEINESGGLILD